MRTQAAKAGLGIGSNQLTFNHHKGIWLAALDGFNTQGKNSLREHVTPIQHDGTSNDIGPLGTAAASTSP